MPTIIEEDLRKTATTDKKVIQNPDIKIVDKSTEATTQVIQNPDIVIQRKEKAAGIVYTAPKAGFISRMYYRVSMFITMYIFFKVLKGKVNGIENIPKSEECILVINHVSYFDWMVVYTYFKLKLDIKITFLAKEKLFSHLLWKPFMICGNCIMVPEKNALSAYKLFMGRIRSEKNIIGIFPEGTRSDSGTLSTAKHGFADIALIKNWPIVPVGLVGFHEFWPKGHMFPRLINNNSKVEVNIGKPYYLNPDVKIVARENVAITIMTKVAKLSYQEHAHR